MKIPARILVFSLIFLVSLSLPLFSLSPLFPLSSFIFPSPAFAAINFLTNPGFEDGTVGWEKYSKTTTFEATSSAVKSGSFSGLITKKSSKGWTYIYQEVEATPSAEYKFSGWTYFNDPDVKYVKLKIDWRDGGNVQLGIPEVKLEDRSPEFQELILTAVAPENSVKAKVEAFINLEFSGPKDSVLFDDLSFGLWTEPEPPPPPVYSSEIFLNEIMPNPEGSDTENEYLELYNAGDEEVDLKGWKVGDEKATKTIGDDIKLSSYLISGGGFLVIYRKDSHLVLNNDGDTVKLLNPADGVVDEITYPEVDEGIVYQRYPDGDSSWAESNQPTAKAANEPSSNSSTSSNDPQVTFSVDDTNLKVNQSLDVKVNIKNAKGLHDYYVKIRLGLEESKLTKGRTYSSFYDSWLWDGKSWKDFPIIYTDSEGGWEGTIKAKVVSSGTYFSSEARNARFSSEARGSYYIGVRIRDKEAEKNYDSESQTILVGEESSETDSVEGVGSVLGTLTELPATGGGVTNLFVTFWLPVIGWMILIFLGSSTTGASVSSNRTIDFIAHKIVHLFEYSVLFVLIHRAVKRSLRGCSKRPTAVVKLEQIVSFVLTVGYAVTDEIHQFFVPGRDARLTDVLIDASAALLAWLVIRRKKLSALVLILILTRVAPVKASSHLSFAVPDGYELKEGEIDHLGGVIDIFDTRGMATSFKPNFNFDLAGFATFVYSYEKHYGNLDPSVFTLTIYEGLMGHCNLDAEPWLRASLLTTTVVEGIAGEAPTYQLFFAFEPIAVKSGQDYTAILTTTETTIGRYRFWIRSDYQDGFALTFNPETQEFSNPSSGHIGAPFGLFVEEGWQGTPPRFHPVVLIHGMGGRPEDWGHPEQDYISLIREMYAGDWGFDYPSSWIHTYHYGNVEGTYNYQGDIRDIAVGLEAVVDDLASRYAESFGETLESLEERDEDRVVDIVGYSMGGLVARQYLIKHQDNHHIRKLVTIATPHQGVYWLARKQSVGTFSRFGPRMEEAISDAFDATIAVLDKSGQLVSLESQAALQMIPRSEFFDFLNLVEWTPLDVQYSTIYGDIDLVLKTKIFFFTMEEKVALGDVFVFSESAVGIPAVEPKEFGYNEEWTFPIGVAVSPEGVSAKFYLEGLDLRKFKFWHLNILHQSEIKNKTVSILVGDI